MLEDKQMLAVAGRRGGGDISNILPRAHFRTTVVD
jgi:hypothetical protein